MQDYIVIGPSPHEEECAMVGEPDYRRRARAECQRFIQLIRETLGPEPEGAALGIKGFEHDFGTYFEVVCHFDTDFPDAVAYARRCDDDTPATWGTPIEVSPKACPTCGSVLEVLLFLGVQPDGYVCPTCQIYYNDDLQPGARVIGGEGV
jgi:hypothetical protein